MNDIESDIRPFTYRCQFCKTWEWKELWDPGRISCPTCGEKQLSPDNMLRHCKVCLCGYKLNMHCKTLEPETNIYPGKYHQFIPGEYGNWND